MVKQVLRSPARPTMTTGGGHPNAKVGAAVFVALYCSPYPVSAQQQPPGIEQSADARAKALQEVVVTANRREQKIEQVPYSMAVVSADEIARTGVTDLVSLAQQVPGLSQFDFGARLSAATTPIIRNINATSAPGAPFRTFEQSPVGTYIGNAPVDGYFQLDDVQQVEVLRGPQGTLYGAGALGGAIRIIPNDPELGRFSGKIEASGGVLAHSSNFPYTVSALLNVPIADTLAFRVSGKYAFEPGFIDVYGILKRPGPFLTAPPALADPSDPVNSAAILTSKKDWNSENAFTGRASALWKPSEIFRVDLTYIFANLNGTAGPSTNSVFPGGPYPPDPRITLPAGGPYNAFSFVDEPYWRRTDLATLDMTYDAGFASLSTTTSYSKTSGMSSQDTSVLSAEPLISAYYAGLPVNPRYVSASEWLDTAHTFTQEVRLVSRAGEGRPVDYVFGIFYENSQRNGSSYSTSPGSYERSVAEGCTGYYYFGAAFPNCLTPVGPNDTNFVQIDRQSFQDRSVFGELTWHFTKNGQVIFGGRHFHQSFTDAQSYTDYTFATYVPATPNSAPASRNTWKINPSYEYARGQHLYMTWSQGFRRGGANSVPLTGFFAESPQLARYAPDSVNNYEVGLKGRLSNGARYAFDVFDIEWDKPQISAALPSGNLAVYNANRARSRGVEFESSGPLFVDSLTYTVGGAYIDARLTEGYSLPANNGAGTIVPGLVNGTAGEQMPGSPKTSVAATLIYELDVGPGYGLDVSLNGTYRGRLPIFLTRGMTETLGSPGFATANVSATLSHDSWRLSLYGTNVTDRRVLLFPRINYGFVSPYSSSLYFPEVINRPREVGIRIGYLFRPAEK